ncbi:hypothetical protein [Alysiella crassa]|uniref:Uncharacterized protein n=1 Tax=Alysiella crassa TaxID=153491 RepID=A0A376BVU8_9NEIS|nr:hypothetical protein [Alysiella crassa]UOP06543.1 hypothetical protein LVJ80_12405 [Alysiella crassa]SSY81076.1 Uncharacterised protein [Alysiella crassa]
MDKVEEQILRIVQQYPLQECDFISTQMGFCRGKTQRILKSMRQRQLLYTKRVGKTYLYTTEPPVPPKPARTTSEEMAFRRKMVAKFGGLPIVF